MTADRISVGIENDTPFLVHFDAPGSESLRFANLHEMEGCLVADLMVMIPEATLSVFPPASPAAVALTSTATDPVALG
ncbi:MAG: hypothetical protein ACK4MD_01530 [Demequina sp.]